MSFSAGSITGELGLDASPQVKAIKTAVAGAKEYREAMASAANASAKAFKNSADSQENTVRKMLQNIKSETGKGSVFGQLLKAGMGGGAIGALSLGAGELNRMTSELSDLKSQYDKGALSQGELTSKILSSLPVFGQLYDAASNVREMITGENAAITAQIAAFDSVIKKNEAAQASWRESVKVAKDVKEAFQAVADQSNDAAALASFAPGKERDTAQVHYEQERRKAELQKQAAAEINQPRIDSLESQLKGKEKGSADYNAINLPLQQMYKNREQITHEYSNAVIALLDEGSAKINAILRNEAKPGLDALAKMKDLAANSGLTEVQRQIAEFSKMPAVTKGMVDQFKALEGKNQLGDLAAQAAELKTALSQVGMDEFQKQFEKIKDGKLLDVNSLAQAQKYIQEMRDATKGIEMKDEAKGLIDSLKTPVDRMNDKIAEFKKLLDAKDITEDQFGSLSAKAKSDAFGPTPANNFLRSGSAESQAARFDGFMQERNNGISSKDQSTQHIKATQELTKVASDILLHLKNQQPTFTSNLPGVA
jgi:hypothetical protein